uniref:Uncharacterized protein n=1 Tax=Sphaerodactylus townsendi TaxID=933632 RepID=A0ACB8EZ88_9SAUR
MLPLTLLARRRLPEQQVHPHPPTTRCHGSHEASALSLLPDSEPRETLQEGCHLPGNSGTAFAAQDTAQPPPPLHRTLQVKRRHQLFPSKHTCSVWGPRSLRFHAALDRRLRSPLSTTPP